MPTLWSNYCYCCYCKALKNANKSVFICVLLSVLFLSLSQRTTHILMKKKNKTKTKKNFERYLVFERSEQWQIVVQLIEYVWNETLSRVFVSFIYSCIKLLSHDFDLFFPLINYIFFCSKALRFPITSEFIVIIGSAICAGKLIWILTSNRCKGTPTISVRILNLFHSNNSNETTKKTQIWRWTKKNFTKLCPIDLLWN